MISGGDWIRCSTQERARKELSEVLDYMVDEAWVEHDDQIVSVPLKDVEVGDTVFVFPGERIPVDGVVLGGRALVDQHALTGESMPVEKAEHDEVFAATVVSEGELRVRATRIGSNTQVGPGRPDGAERAGVRHPSAGLRRTLGEPARALQPVGRRHAGADRSLHLGRDAAGDRLLPRASGSSAPTAIMSTMTRAARQGIFIRGGRHVELLGAGRCRDLRQDGHIDDRLPGYRRGESASGQRYTRAEVLALAAAAERYLTHPVAQAVVKAARTGG